MKNSFSLFRNTHSFKQMGEIMKNYFINFMILLTLVIGLSTLLQANTNTASKKTIQTQSIKSNKQAVLALKATTKKATSKQKKVTKENPLAQIDTDGDGVMDLYDCMPNNPKVRGIMGCGCETVYN